MKKVIFAVIAILIVGAILFIVVKPQSNSRENTEENPAPTIEEETITNLSHEEKAKEEETDTYTLSIKYPEVSGPSIASSINSSITYFTSTATNEFYSQVENGAFFPDMKSSLSIEYAWREPAHNILTIPFTVSTYISGAAHPFSYIRTLNFDVKTGEPIEIHNLFESDINYLGQLSTLSKEYLHLFAEDRDIPLDTLWIDEGVSAKKENFQSFIVERNHLKIIFNPYQVAPYVVGVIEIEIPLERLEGFRFRSR